MSRERAKAPLVGAEDRIDGIENEGLADALAAEGFSAQGLRNCLAHLEREAEQRGFALTAHLLAVAGDAVLEEQAAHGCQRPH